MGPIDYSTNYVCALLIHGFQHPPTLLTAHNPPYYAPLIESCGFSKAKDWYAWWFSEYPEPAARLRKIADARARKEKVTIRPIVQIHHVAQGTAPRQDGENPPGGRVAHSMLEICVSDSGQGIPDGHLQRIFERFHRVDTRLTRETNGLGLGLTICKRIVELHDGLIWAENRLSGEGAAFYVRLPIDEPPG